MKQTTCVLKRSRQHALVVVNLSILWGGTAAGLSAQPSIRIAWPADGTVVHPGQTVQVRVVTSEKFEAVVVIPLAPIRPPGPPSDPPYTFTLRIPDRGRISPGPYRVTAIGAIGPESERLRSQITLQVEEPDDAPIKFEVHPFSLELHPGEKFRQVDALAVFPDGHSVGLDQSAYSSFKSTAPGVATVDNGGIVTAVAPGTTKIVVTYRNFRAETSVTVLVKR